MIRSQKTPAGIYDLCPLPSLRATKQLAEKNATDSPAEVLTSQDQLSQLRGGASVLREL